MSVYYYVQVSTVIITA